MTFSVIQYIVFVGCFAISFYALSAIQFEKFCNVRTPAKVITLMFVLSFVLAYLCTQAILNLTILSGFGG
ncbi:MAG: DUF1146 domain-containing protein [Firmicutes bacterium]|nr:DUF1146 domain-containing protein [Bacillota bacterium]